MKIHTPQWRAREMPIRPDSPLLSTGDILLDITITITITIANPLRQSMWRHFVGTSAFGYAAMRYIRFGAHYTSWRAKSTSTLGHINASESATGTLPHIDTYTDNHTHHPQTKWRAREMPIRPDRPLPTSCDVAV